MLQLWYIHGIGQKGLEQLSIFNCVDLFTSQDSPTLPSRYFSWVKVSCNNMLQLWYIHGIGQKGLEQLYNMHVYFCMHKYMFPINRSKLSILPDQIILSQVLAFGVLKVNDNFNRHQLNVSISSHILGGSVCLGCKGLLTVMRRLNLFFRLKIYFSSHLFCLFKCRWGGSHLS